MTITTDPIQRHMLLQAAIAISDLALDLKESSDDAEAEAEYKRLWALRDELLKLRKGK